MISPYDAGFLFAFKARRRAHSWDYVTEAATLKTGKKTSKMGILFASKSLATRISTPVYNALFNGFIRNP